MLKKNKGLILSVSIVLLLLGISSQLVFSKDKKIVSNNGVSLDDAVTKVLKEMPEIKINKTQTLNDVNLVSVEETLDSKKAEFRLKVQNETTDLNHNNEYLEKSAVADTERYLKAIQIAKEVYGVSITQEEVNNYIDENIASVVTPEKEEYAKALGLTLYELDYIFDRDFYVMDTLWDKLIPVLMEQHPQKDGEDDNQYLERIRKEFHSKL